MSKRWLSRIKAFFLFLTNLLVGSVLLWALLSGVAMALVWVARSLGFELGDDSWIRLRGSLITEVIPLVALVGLFYVFYKMGEQRGKGRKDSDD